MQFSAIFVFALATASTHAAAVKPTVTITGTGAADVGANHLGCAHITPANQSPQLVCTNTFTTSGFSISVKDEKTGVRTSCTVKGTSGTCGPSGAGAKISALARRHHTEAQIAAKEAKAKVASSPVASSAAASSSASNNSAITITGTGAASLPAKPDGCATITPAGQGAQTVCAKDITATGFTMSVKDVATGAKISCTVKGTSGTCGTTGAGASVSALAKRHHTEAQIAAKEAKAKVASSPAASSPAASSSASSNSAITITGTGAASLPAKPDGCATITPAGQGAQTVCAKDITATGFTMSVKDVATGTKISCTVKGTSGTCGTTGAGASVSALAKRHHTEAQIAAKEAKANAASNPAASSSAASSPAASNSTITITGTGAASLPAKPDGCATITPAGQGAQTVCAKDVTATGFTMSVKDVATGAKISCTVKGTSGTCGTTGAGASVSALAKREAEDEDEEIDD